MSMNVIQADSPAVCLNGLLLLGDMGRLLQILPQDVNRQFSSALLLHMLNFTLHCSNLGLDVKAMLELASQIACIHIEVC